MANVSPETMPSIELWWQWVVGGVSPGPEEKEEVARRILHGFCCHCRQHLSSVLDVHLTPSHPSPAHVQCQEDTKAGG